MNAATLKPVKGFHPLPLGEGRERGRFQEAFMKRTVLMLAMTLAANGWADETAGAFLKITPSVRGEALGGLNPAAVSGAQAMGVNPANLAQVSGREFTSGFATMIGDSSYGTAGLGLRRNDRVVLGAHVTYLQSGTLEGRDAAGNLTRDFNARDMAAGLTAAMGDEDFRAGVTGKAVRQEVGEFKSNTSMAIDGGVSMKTGNLSLSAAALNLGGKLKFRGEERNLPVIYSLGASLPLGSGLTGLGGVSQIAGETVASMGVEYNLKSVSLRAGYRGEGGENLAKKSQKGGEQALGGLTGGIGVEINSWRLDYAVSQTAAEFGMSHRAAVTFKWGGEIVDERPVDREPRRKAPAAARKPAPKKSSTTTGRTRAYDPAPVRKKKASKRWVY
jgi:hypothetical protein